MASAVKRSPMRPASLLTDLARLENRSAMSLSVDAMVSLTRSTFADDDDGSMRESRERRPSRSSSSRSTSAARARCASCHGIEGYPDRIVYLLEQRARPSGTGMLRVELIYAAMSEIPSTIAAWRKLFQSRLLLLSYG